MEIRVTSTSIDIVCMPAVTPQNNVSTETMNYEKYFDQIIFKWQSNGMDYCDTSTTANNDCLLIGYSNRLWDTKYLTNNNFDDQKMLNQLTGLRWYVNVNNLKI